MRYSLLAGTFALTLACVSSAVLAQKPDSQIDPRSITFMKAGEAALAARNYQGAIDKLETALAIDPRNRGAYVVLGHAYQGEELPGKAIGFYAKALTLEPNDLAALQGQGEAMVQRGAVTRAQANLKRIRELCKKECAPAQTLAAAITKGPPAAVVTAQTATKAPSPETEAAPPIQN